MTVRNRRLTISACFSMTFAGYDPDQAVVFGEMQAVAGAGVAIARR